MIVCDSIESLLRDCISIYVSLHFRPLYKFDCIFFTLENESLGNASIIEKSDSKGHDI